METVRTGRMWNGEAKKARKLKNADRYRHLFPKAELKDTLIKRNAEVKDTIQFIPQAVRLTLGQVRAFVRQELMGYSLMETCRRIWQFLYDHIDYKKDQSGKEQIRSPARTMHDLVADCDDYATFISAILCVKKIPHFLRVTKYSGSWQHIYVVVPVPGGRHITIDCVVDRFNYEVSYTDKIDVKMDLEFLSGLDSASEQEKKYAGYSSYDISGLGGSDFAELGKLINKAKLKAAVKKVGKASGKVIKAAGKIVKEGLHVINRVNPATLLLRNGILASMKLNTFNVAARIKWAYLTEAQAIQKGIDPVKHRHLKQVLTKLEKIFYGAGGKSSNLKKAILKGKGNSRKEVSGLGLVDPSEVYTNGLEASLPLSEMLGIEMYLDENQAAINGLYGQGLGEPATATALTAASGAMATIAAAIKKIGNIFKKAKHPDFAEETKAPGSSGSGTSKEEPDNSAPQPPADEDSPSADADEGAEEKTTPENTEAPETPQTPAGSGEGRLQTKEVPSGTTTNKPAEKGKDEKSFMEKYGTALKVVGFGTLGIGVITLLVQLSKGKDKKSKKGKGLSGAPKGKKSKKLKMVRMG